MTAATTHVAVTTPSNGSAAPAFGLTLVRMIGFKKMMYDMTMKVVTPAIVSRASVVPCAVKRNRRSRNPSWNVAARLLIELFPPRWSTDTVSAEITQAAGRKARGRTDRAFANCGEISAAVRAQPVDGEVDGRTLSEEARLGGADPADGDLVRALEVGAELGEKLGVQVDVFGFV